MVAKKMSATIFPMREKENSFGRIAAVYLIGLLIGGLYVGLVAPVRTVIQADFGIGNTQGIWIINIYTLFYAALIPTSGKLADRYGRKRIFTACLTLFTIGLLMCGFAQHASSFSLLIAGRIVQAAGAGGIIPVATAEMGTSAPEGKRGMWLGIAAAISGISNVLGAAVGSFITSITGVSAWGWSFFICVPICALLLVAALAWLPNTTPQRSGKLDVAGSVFFTLFLILLLAGLTGLNSEGASVGQVAVPLVLAVVFAIVFLLAERRASDPIFHMEYLVDLRILPLLIASIFVGGCVISMVIIPEFAEAALNAPVGSGGYYMAILGVFAIVGPPVGGKLIDKHGGKPVFAIGSVSMCIGYLFLALVVTTAPSVPLMLLGLAIVGFGMGFTMGTPLNYLMLQATPPEESNAAIATLSLMRQVGTTVAPSILVGLIASGAGLDGYRAMLIAVAAFSVAALVFVCAARR